MDFILQANKLSMDVHCFEFEKQFAQFHETKHAVLVNSGASANLLLLQALLNPGRLKKDENVGFSSLSWSTNVMPIVQLGLKPVPVDCDINTLNSMEEGLRAAHERHGLKAFFITNVLRLPRDLDKIKSYCEAEGILLSEDNCEALGNCLNGTLTGNFGLTGTLSFFVAHHMSTVEGGMLDTKDDELAEMLVIAGANGWDRNLPAISQKRLRQKPM